MKHVVCLLKSFLCIEEKKLNHAKRKVHQWFYQHTLFMCYNFSLVLWGRGWSKEGWGMGGKHCGYDHSKFDLLLIRYLTFRYSCPDISSWGSLSVDRTENTSNCPEICDGTVIQYSEPGTAKEKKRKYLRGSRGMLPRKILKVKTKICAVWGILEANLKKSSTKIHNEY